VLHVLTDHYNDSTALVQQPVSPGLKAYNLDSGNLRLCVVVTNWDTIQREVHHLLIANGILFSHEETIS